MPIPAFADHFERGRNPEGFHLACGGSTAGEFSGIREEIR
jgi:hypothetical protein